MATRIIGVGASAGGIRALEALLAELPRGLGVAFVVVQHLSPNYASSMASILQRSTELTVVALDRDTVPEPDHVYIKPPNWDVYLGDMLTLTPRKTSDKGLYLPIDNFFFSLAESRKQDAIGIVLSGMGTDGSRGLSDIKEWGGIVMVQKPDSAQFDGMPRAVIRRQIADVVLPPEQLASRLVSILRKEESELNPNTSSLDGLSGVELIDTMLERVRKVTSIDFKKYRQSTILRRVEKRMLITQHDSIEQYITHALTHEEELQLLRQSFLIGVTRFFRDQAAFAVIQSVVIPRLFEQAGEGGLRIWVPSCSTGEEVYSLAFLLEDYRAEQGVSTEYKIFCSDVDRRAVALASRGEYDEGIMADVPGDMLQRYFIHRNKVFQVKKSIRERILFAVQNLLEDPPFIRVDLISCRNFLIYINTDIQQRVLSNFYFGLRPQGFLLLGPSENLGALQSAFHTIDRRWKLYQKRPGGQLRNGLPVTPAIPTTMTGNAKFPAVVSEVDLLHTPVKESPAPPYSKPLQMDYFSRYMAERYAPATLFVNGNYDILYLNGDFDGVLRLPRFNAQLSIRTVVDEKLQSILTAGVDSVLASGKSGVFEHIKIDDQRGEGTRWLKVRFSRHEFYELPNAIAILEFYPADQSEVDPEDGDEVYSVDRQLQQKIRNLELELKQSEARTQKLLNELEATNEELQASNRELLASNEEMQSTNEELQSVNEELYTVNNEFQRKNEELNEVNNDVSNLLKSTQISTIFVDQNLHIRRFTPGVAKQFDLHVSDLGRPITSFANPFANVDFEALCREVMESGSKHDEEAIDNAGNTTLIRLLPYLTEQKKDQGVVITFMDINDLIRSRRRYTDLARKYEAIFHNTKETIAVIRQNSRIEEINQPIAGRDIDELTGAYFLDLLATDQEKVRFNEVLRGSFDRNEVTTMVGNLQTQYQSLVHVNIEIIPINPVESSTEEANTIEQAVIIIHDVTDRERRRRESAKLIADYQTRLEKLQQAAGLIDLEGKMVHMNHTVPELDLGLNDYIEHNVRDFLTEQGQQRFDGAVNKLKHGSTSERVDYPLEELKQDRVPRTVIYRPVLAYGKMVFISFEIQEPPSTT